MIWRTMMAPLFQFQFEEEKKYIHSFDHWAVNTATRKSKYMDVSKQANRHKYVTDECRLKIIDNR